MNKKVLTPKRNIENILISELKPYAYNSRTHDLKQIEQIIESIKEFGFTNPVLIDKTKQIIAGHGRFEAAKKMELKEIPCICLDDLTQEQIRAYVIADNKLALNAGWDIEILASELKALEDLGYNTEVIGFNEKEFDDLMASLASETENGLDDVPDISQIEPVAKIGDIYELGEHRLMCGDSTNPEAIKALMNGNLADLLNTDPPYNVDYEGSNGLKIENDKKSDEDFLSFLTKALSNGFDYLRAGASFYIWHADMEGYNFRRAVKDCGQRVRQLLIWKKQAIIMGRQDYQSQHEPCLYGWKEGASHFWNSDRKQSTILEFDRPKKNDIHPTMKPVELIEYQIKNSSEKGNIILDLFGGSGTAIIACENSGRRCYTMEYDPRYVDVIINRWESFTGRKAILTNGQRG